MWAARARAALPASCNNIGASRASASAVSGNNSARVNINHA
jgi:hypothetical protein